MITPEEVARQNYLRLRVEALTKEAEFLRAEALLCISRVRYLAMFAIVLAGAALPAIATIMSSETSTGGFSTEEILIARSLPIQFITGGVGLCALALLQIYVGVFKQIFAFAKYFREHLVPDLNRALGDAGASAHDSPVFQWEVWLQGERLKSGTYTADVDLRAEPILISIVAVVYLVACLGVSIHADSLVGVSLVLMLVSLVFIFLKFLSFSTVLKGSTQGDGA